MNSLRKAKGSLKIECPQTMADFEFIAEAFQKKLD